MHAGDVTHSMHSTLTPFAVEHLQVLCHQGSYTVPLVIGCVAGIPVISSFPWFTPIHCGSNFQSSLYRPFLLAPHLSLNHWRETVYLGLRELKWLRSLGAVGIGDLQMTVRGLDLCSFCALILAIPSSAWPASVPHGFDFLFALSPLGSERNRISECPSATISKVFSFSWLLTILLIVSIKLLEF